MKGDRKVKQRRSNVLHQQNGSRKLFKYDWQGGLVGKGAHHKCDNLGMIPGIHMVERESKFLQVVLLPSHMQVCTLTNTH